MNHISNFLSKEGWKAGNEFGISIQYKGEHEAVSVMQFTTGKQNI